MAHYWTLHIPMPAEAPPPAPREKTCSSMPTELMPSLHLPMPATRTKLEDINQFDASRCTFFVPMPDEAPPPAPSEKTCASMPAVAPALYIPKPAEPMPAQGPPPAPSEETFNSMPAVVPPLYVPMPAEGPPPTPSETFFAHSFASRSPATNARWEDMQSHASRAYAFFAHTRATTSIK